MPLTEHSAHAKDLRTGLAEMQHRHFATIATIIRAMPGARSLRVSREEAEQIAEHFARYLAETNPNFDRARFLAACQANEP